MNNMLSKNGEINLLVRQTNIVAFQSLEDWQVDMLTSNIMDDTTTTYTSVCLQNIDDICKRWLKSLTADQWNKINRQKSLFGIPIPPEWIKVWRFILKEPKLRNAERASRQGRAIGSYSHLWNIWAEDCIEKYLNPIEKELLKMVDEGFCYEEIGIILKEKYGDAFWKIRKKNSKTRPGQVVNNYLYHKMPVGIAKQELRDLCLSKLAQLKSR